MENPKTTELLPCPFCGSAAKIHEYDSGTNWYFVLMCTGTDCMVEPWFDGDTEEEVVSRWNRRTPSVGAPA